MKFAVLGYGNLGQALASALTCTGLVFPDDIYICDSSRDALSLAEGEHFHVFETQRINDFISGADVICLVVKSYVFEEIAAAVDKRLFQGKNIISFMAGVTIGRLRELLCADGAAIGKTDAAAVQIALAMPSLAIAKNEGIIAYTKLPDSIAAVFDKFGYAFEVEPENIGKVTAFASCGLGFAAYLLDAYKEAGQALGFPPETASQMAALTFRNACGLGDFKDTVKAVATKGGVTEQGIMHMDSMDVYGIIAEAVKKAYMKVR